MKEGSSETTREAPIVLFTFASCAFVRPARLKAGRQTCIKQGNQRQKLQSKAKVKHLGEDIVRPGRKLLL